MSDLEAYGDPEHECGEQCAPYEPLADRDLEDLEESAHIDALYDDLNLTREHAALLFIQLARSAPDLRVAPRTAALLLDISEEEIEAAMGDGLHRAEDIVNHAIAVDGEDGYMGQALVSMFRMQLHQAS